MRMVAGRREKRLKESLGESFLLFCFVFEEKKKERITKNNKM